MLLIDWLARLYIFDEEYIEFLDKLEIPTSWINEPVDSHGVLDGKYPFFEREGYLYVYRGAAKRSVKVRILTSGS